MRKGRGRNGHNRQEESWRVVDDFPGVVPVTPEELDVVGAFLMAQFRAVMASESPAKPDVFDAADSEPPHCDAAVGHQAKNRGGGR